MQKMKQKIKAVLATLVDAVIRFILLFYEALCNLLERVIRKEKP